MGAAGLMLSWSFVNLKDSKMVSLGQCVPQILERTCGNRKYDVMAARLLPKRCCFAISLWN